MNGKLQNLVKTLIISFIEKDLFIILKFIKFAV